MNPTQEALEALLKAMKEHGDTVGSSILLEGSAEGSKIPSSHLSKIKKWTRTEQDPEKIHTYPVLMIDTAPTRNQVIYTEASQRKSIKGWRGITYLFNARGTSSGFFSSGADHTLQAASQMARIYDSRVVKTPKGETGSLGWFYTVEGIDDTTDSFIRKLEAGILREVSIHVTVPEGVVCSICNGPFSECEEKSGARHYPGEKYGKKMCYMSTGEGLLVPLELSSVACPGSVNAHVMQDDEVENYPVVSLSEALGGSREVIQAIRTENSMKTKEQIAEDLQKVVEAAAQAGVSLAEAGKSIKLVISTEAKKCAECGHEAHGSKECGSEGCECTGSKQSKKPDDKDEPKEDDEKKNSDPPEDDDKKSKKQADKPKYPLFEGDCVVCGRSETQAPQDETEKIKEMRKSFQEQVKGIVKKAEETVRSLEDDMKVSQEKADQFDVLFDGFVAETVEIAIAIGHKKSCEKQAYHDHLKTLSYQAVKEIHDVFKIKTKAVEPKSEKEKLEQSMVDRAKENLGTQVVTDKDGRKKTRTERRALFAATAR